MINLAIFDMDGTLTSKKDNQIPESTYQALEQLKKQNIKVVVATGRPIYGFDKDVMKKIGADAFVLNNGRIVLDNNNQKLFDEPIASDFLNTTLDLINQFELDYALHLEHETIMVRGDSIERVINTITSKTDHVRKVKKLPENLKTYNIMVHILDTKQKDDFLKKLPNAVIEEFYPGFYDIYPNDMDKSIGLKFLLNKYNTNWSNTIAFGDGLNDYCYLSKSHNAYRMEDGYTQLKEIKGISIAPPSSENGIEKILIKNGLIEYADKSHGWIRFKHRFVMTNMRYTLPISFFLLLFYVYDNMISNTNTMSYLNLVMSFIFFGMSVNVYLKRDL